MKQSPKTLAAFHLIIMPGIFVLLLMFSGNIKTVVGMFWDQSWAEFDDVFFYSLMLVLFVNRKYLFRWRKTSTEEYFKTLDHEYVISERGILEKIRKASLITFIIILMFTIIQFYGNERTTTGSQISLLTVFLFSTLFAAFITYSNCHYRISNQNSKKHFRLFLASGFFKAAMSIDNDLKTKVIKNGLSWLNAHYKRKHVHIKDLEKINLKI